MVCLHVFSQRSDDSAVFKLFVAPNWTSDLQQNTKLQINRRNKVNERLQRPKTKSWIGGGKGSDVDDVEQICAGPVWDQWSLLSWSNNTLGCFGRIKKGMSRRQWWQRRVHIRSDSLVIDSVLRQWQAQSQVFKLRETLESWRGRQLDWLQLEAVSDMGECEERANQSVKGVCEGGFCTPVTSSEVGNYKQSKYKYLHCACQI